jgi:hypothetical protein
MMNSAPDPGDAAMSQEEAVNGIVRSGSRGAIALAAIATAIVVACWFAFYLLVFVPRATAP